MSGPTIRDHPERRGWAESWCPHCGEIDELPPNRCCYLYNVLHGAVMTQATKEWAKQDTGSWTPWGYVP